MKISLTPRRRDDTLTVEKNGDVLTINGVAFDFSGLPEGATILAGNVPCIWIWGDVERVGGDLHINLALPHGSEPAECVAFPALLDNPPDGILDLPFSPYSTTLEQLTEGGRNITTTRYEWRTAPVTTTEFIADSQPEPENEESANVDA